MIPPPPDRTTTPTSPQAQAGTPTSTPGEVPGRAPSPSVGSLARRSVAASARAAQAARRDAAYRVLVRGLPEIRPARAYLLLAGLLLALTGPDLVLNPLVLVDIVGGPDLMDHVPDWVGDAMIIAVAAGWLLALLPRSDRPLPVRAALMIAAAALAVGAILTLGESSTFTERADPIGLAAVTVWLCWEVLHRHGITLTHLGVPGPSAVKAAHPAQGAAVFSTALAAQVITSMIMAWLGTKSWLPHPTQSQAEALGINDDTAFLIRASLAGVREELLWVAVAAVLLLTARRHVWTIYTAAVVLRIAPHLYLGFEGAAVGVFAAVHAWLFLRTRRLLPLVLAHAVYNVAVVYHRDTFAIGVLAAAIATACIAAGTFNRTTAAEAD
ncbi:CPBP family intramembrane glutamic endopeptidase [Actinomadura yumaensis]|uniref:CPBP family intramembrane glutamic endopeptidase n=1 Tax=Actinomadura yumaensis TaxID=111807 RepID=A0ABW2CNL3_9ACTN